MCKMNNHNLHSFRANVLWILSHTTLFSNKYYELNVDDSFLNTQYLNIWNILDLTIKHTHSTVSSNLNIISTSKLN